jgi:hypothetical protein
MSAWTAVHRMAKPPERLVRLVLESHDGTALVPIPERSTSPRATSTLYRWGSLIALDPNRPIREADIVQHGGNVRFVPKADIQSAFPSALTLVFTNLQTL